MYLKFIMPLAPFVEKIVDLLHELMSVYKPRNLTITHSMWIIIVWHHISPEVILKVFKKCYISIGGLGCLWYVVEWQ